MSGRKKRGARRVDEEIPLRVRNIEEELPKPIGIYGENVSNSVFINNVFVGVPTPIYIKGGRNNVFWNNKAYP